jgi:hypothetical protein
MFFMHRIRKTSGTYDKGIEVKETLDAAKQSYHAFLGAWAYGHDANTDFVNAMISDDNGSILYNEVWADIEEQE